MDRVCSLIRLFCFKELNFISSRNVVFNYIPLEAYYEIIEFFSHSIKEMKDLNLRYLKCDSICYYCSNFRYVYLHWRVLFFQENDIVHLDKLPAIRYFITSITVISLRCSTLFLSIFKLFKNPICIPHFTFYISISTIVEFDFYLNCLV